MDHEHVRGVHIRIKKWQVKITNIAYLFSLLNVMVISILVHQTFIVMKFNEEEGNSVFFRWCGIRLTLAVL